jgi:hypothetical protein
LTLHTILSDGVTTVRPDPWQGILSVIASTVTELMASDRHIWLLELQIVEVDSAAQDAITLTRVLSGESCFRQLMRSSLSKMSLEFLVAANFCGLRNGEKNMLQTGRA